MMVYMVIEGQVTWHFELTIHVFIIVKNEKFVYYRKSICVQ
jgi:hypothetical protein